MNRARDHAGFTLVELLVVVTLMGMAVGLAVFRLDGLTESGRLRASGAKIITLLRLGVQEARTAGEPRLIEYSTGTNGVALRAPVMQDGRWRWQVGGEHRLESAVRVERVLAPSATPKEQGRTAVTITPDGRCGQHAVILEHHGRYGVVLAGGPDEPRWMLTPRRPDAGTLELLILELESMRDEG